MKTKLPPPIPKESVAALRKIQEQIREHSDQFNMRAWFTDNILGVENRYAGGCGTAGCIAGWYKFNEIRAVHKDATMTQAAYHCGNNLDSDAIMSIWWKLRGNVSMETPWLFGIYDWPQHIRDRHHRATNTAEEAEAACEAIDWFIDNRGSKEKLDLPKKRVRKRTTKKVEAEVAAVTEQEQETAVHQHQHVSI